jgi:hypothetical protein
MNATLAAESRSRLDLNRFDTPPANRSGRQQTVKAMSVGRGRVERDLSENEANTFMGLRTEPL